MNIKQIPNSLYVLIYDCDDYDDCDDCENERDQIWKTFHLLLLPKKESNKDK